MQFSGVADRLAVERGDDVAGLEACFAAGRIRRDAGDDRADGLLHVEELRAVGRDVFDGDADVAVADFTVADEGGHRRLGDLGGDCKTHSGKGAGGRVEEGVDADELAASVDQRTAGVAGIDGGVGLDEFTRLAAIGVRVRAVERTDDAVAFDLDDREIGERIGADELCRIDVAVAHRDADVGGTSNYVVIGDDEAIGRDDDAAAEAVFKGGLLLLLRTLEALGTLEELAEGRAGTEELLKLLLLPLLILTLVLALVLILVSIFGHLVVIHFGGDINVDDSGTDARGERFHCQIKGDERRNAAFIERCGCRRRGGCCRCGTREGPCSRCYEGSRSEDWDDQAPRE